MTRIVFSFSRRGSKQFIHHDEQVAWIKRNPFFGTRQWSREMLRFAAGRKDPMVFEGNVLRENRLG